MPVFSKFTFSNFLILISILFTVIGYLIPWFISEWSINNRFLYQNNYFHWVIQFFTWTFIHWGLLHLLMNSIFIYYFWNILELVMWKNKYISFFILSVIFNWVLLSYFASSQYTIWISWFALAIITYYTLELKSQKNPEYKWWLTAIIINLWIWFYPWVSFYWHLFWVVFWIIFFYLTKDFIKKQFVWLFRYRKINNKKQLGTFNIKEEK